MIRALQGLAAGFALLAAGCATAPPDNQGNLCSVFEQYPDWYDYARASERAWGTPVPVQMAFVHRESSYRSHARPPRKWLLWVIPWGRQTSAKGYSQALDGTWAEYEKERGGWFRSRSDMEDALDFIGWYNRKSHRRLGIAYTDAYSLYIAYHEGRGGYRSGKWKNKQGVKTAAGKVARTAERYTSQLAKCESRFRCDSWYQIWPFCS